MIVADTSAILAVVFDEPERGRFARVVEAANKVLISTVSVVECRMVVQARRGQAGTILLNDLFALRVFEPVPPGGAEVEAAYAAFVTFGRGSGHPAGLNFGDLFSYALAKTRNLPLLFKGSDFIHTDVGRADVPVPGT